MTVKKGYGMGRRAVKGFAPKRAGSLRASRSMRSPLAMRMGRKGGKKGY